MVDEKRPTLTEMLQTEYENYTRTIRDNISHEYLNRVEKTKYLTLIWALFQGLKELIYYGCGLGNATRDFPILLSPSNTSIYDKATLNYIERQTGIAIISQYINNGCWANVDLSKNEGKIYKYDENYISLQLNFKELLWENQRRNQQWKEFLPTFAAKIITISQECLETMPDRIYGVKEWTQILRGNFEAFVGSFKFYDQEIRYEKLTAEQINALSRAINERVSHGCFVLCPHKSLPSVLQVSIFKKPDKVVAAPLLDYQEYYEKYQTATDELKRIFRHIGNNLKVTSLAEQIQTLDNSGPKLYYDSKAAGLNYERLAEAPELLDSLTNELNQLYPKVTFTGAKVNEARNRIFFYYYYNLADTHTEVFIVEGQQIELSADNIIKKIKAPNIIREIARALAESIFYKYIKKQFVTTFSEDVKWVFDRKLLTVKVQIEDETWKVSLNKVNDYKFLNKIEEAFSEETNGILKIHLIENELEINSHLS